MGGREEDAPDALDGDKLGRFGGHVAERVERRDTGAHQRGDLGRIHTVRDGDDGLSA